MDTKIRRIEKKLDRLAEAFVSLSERTDQMLKILEDQQKNTGVKRNDDEGRAVVVENPKKCVHVSRDDDENRGRNQQQAQPQVNGEGFVVVDQYAHPGKTFVDAAREMSWATDKVTYHRYDYIYEKYLGPLRNRPFKILEIGLGCSTDMYAPGHGYALLKKYVPQVEYHAIEYNKQCPDWLRRIGRMSKEEAIKKKHPVFGPQDAQWIIDHTVWGDQSSPDVMREVVSRFGAETFDVIIDDGSHISDHMVNSMKYLYTKALKPGGVYIVEDIQMVFTPGGGGGRDAQQGRKTFVAFVQDLILWQQFEWWAPSPHKLWMQGEKHTDIVEWLRNVDCDREICAFGKLLSRHGPDTFHRPRALPEPNDYRY